MITVSALTRRILEPHLMIAPVMIEFVDHHITILINVTLQRHVTQTAPYKNIYKLGHIANKR